MRQQKCHLRNSVKDSCVESRGEQEASGVSRRSDVATGVATRQGVAVQRAVHSMGVLRAAECHVAARARAELCAFALPQTFWPSQTISASYAHSYQRTAQGVPNAVVIR